MEKFIGRDIKDMKDYSNQSKWGKHLAEASIVFLLGAGLVEGTVYDFRHVKNAGRNAKSYIAGSVQAGADTLFGKPVSRPNLRVYSINETVEYEIDGKKKTKLIKSPFDVSEIQAENPLWKEANGAWYADANGIHGRAGELKENKENIERWNLRPWNDGEKFTHFKLKCPFEKY